MVNIPVLMTGGGATVTVGVTVGVIVEVAVEVAVGVAVEVAVGVAVKIAALSPPCATGSAGATDVAGMVQATTTRANASPALKHTAFFTVLANLASIGVSSLQSKRKIAHCAARHSAV